MIRNDLLTIMFGSSKHTSRSWRIDFKLAPTHILSRISHAPGIDIAGLLVRHAAPMAYRKVTEGKETKVGLIYSFKGPEDEFQKKVTHIVWYKQTSRASELFSKRGRRNGFGAVSGHHAVH